MESLLCFPLLNIALPLLLLLLLHDAHAAFDSVQSRTETLPSGRFSPRPSPAARATNFAASLIQLDSSLSPRDEKGWLSANAIFELTFVSVGVDNFVLAIRYASLPEKTVVWMANRERPVGPSAILSLTAYGDLIIKEAQGDVVWSAGTPTGTVVGGILTDSGNMLLLAAGNAILWQSFDYPTSTLLPRQKLAMNTMLYAPYNYSIPAAGRYSLRMQGDGNLVLYEFGMFPYWATGAKPQVELSSFYAEFTPDGSLYVVLAVGFQEQPFVVADIKEKIGEGTYVRITLDPDGVLRIYYWDSSSWIVGWSSSSPSW